MTVKELIECLKFFEEDLEVCFVDVNVGDNVEHRIDGGHRTATKARLCGKDYT